jgi:hypothetical protein
MNTFRKMPPALLRILAASFIIALIVGFNVVPFLRGGEWFGWQWPYEPVPFPLVLPFLLILTIYLIGVFWLGERGKPRWVLLWAFLGAAVLPLLVIGLRHANPITELYYRTVSPTATGPYFAAGRIDWASGTWHDWSAMMVEWRVISQHIALSPPGLPLLYRLLNGIINVIPGLAGVIDNQLLPLQCNNYSLLEFTSSERASALFGILMPVWAALAVFPLYAIAFRMIDYGARWLVSGWALVPALLLFAPSWNTLYPLLALIAFWMLLKGIDGQRGWFVASGFIVGLLTFFNFSTVPLAALFGFYMLLHYALNVKAWRLVLPAAGLFGLGAVLIWLVFGIWTGSWVFGMLATAFEQHLALERGFLPGLLMHSWEWALLSGLPFVGLWLVVIFKRKPGDDVLPQALLLTLIVLLLSNTARGETGRVWLFFTPFAMLCAGQMMRKWDYWSFDWLSPMIVQAILLVALASTWNVMAAPDIQPRPATPPVHENIIPLDARFEPSFTLTGWSGSYDGDSITLNLNWQSATQLTVPYYFAALPVAPDGSNGDAVVWQPQATRYPTTCWLPNMPLGDTIQIPLPDNALAGEWYISLTAFADVDNPMETLPITQAGAVQGTQDRQIGLGPIVVEPN